MFYAMNAIARLFSILARFWKNTQFPKAREKLSFLSAKKKNNLTLLVIDCLDLYTILNI